MAFPCVITGIDAPGGDEVLSVSSNSLSPGSRYDLLALARSLELRLGFGCVGVLSVSSPSESIFLRLFFPGRANSDDFARLPLLFESSGTASAGAATFGVAACSVAVFSVPLFEAD